ncbi:MAG: four helix bundle protein [Bacteroidetes bacterium]|nr:four helix bundle protein [Bacteroidota bacterium]
MENESERTITFFRFEDLRIYHKAAEYAEWVHANVKGFPAQEATQQLGGKFLQSAMNIALNIAEGSSRNKSQFVYYLKMAKSSVRECVVLTTICNRQGLLSDDNQEESRNHLMEMTKMIGALIGSLQRSVKGPGQGMDDDDEDV